MSKRIPSSPKQAAKCGGPIDSLLRPDLFRALGDPTRARLLGCLAKCGRSCSVTEVAECCAVDFSVVSRHLALLERAGVVKSLKEGRTVSYRVEYAAISRTLRELSIALTECCPEDCACAPKSSRAKGASCGCC